MPPSYTFQVELCYFRHKTFSSLVMTVEVETTCRTANNIIAFAQQQTIGLDNSWTFQSGKVTKSPISLRTSEY